MGFLKEKKKGKEGRGVSAVFKNINITKTL